MSTRTLALYDTTMGKKAVMAITGFILIGFVVGHMVGNLQIFAGPQKLNAYAHFLHSMQGPLWGARLVLLASVGLHLWSAISLTLQNYQARPVGYQRKADLITSYAAKTMIWGGIILAFFIFFHILHLTTGSVGPEGFNPGNVYGNVITGFKVSWISGFYIIAQLALALHIYHGAWSFLQTLGANHPRYNSLRKIFSVGLALLIAVGNISIPVAVMAGFLN